MSGNSTRTIRDVTKNLQAHFAASKIPLSLPSESRRMLQSFIDENQHRIEVDEATKANQELKQFWDRHVAGNPQKLGAFVGVLRELRAAIVSEDDLLEWYYLAGKPVLGSVGLKKTAMDDAQEFVASVMIYDEDENNAKQRSRTSTRICSDLLNVYLARTRGVADEDQFVAPENAQIAQQVEAVLVACGRKMPRQLIHNIDHLIVRAETRLQALTLLSSFLRHQTPHIYTVQHTPVVDNLLKCLMNDTSTTVISLALTSLIMLLPHIPGSLNSRLPLLFLIYSRLLCWERFSALTTDAQKHLVTDDRIAADDYDDHGDVGIDSTWEKCTPPEGIAEASTPELKTYYTYLYGLYPLNFMSYIRKPRRFLKNVDFPAADDFDLDQAVIRSRSDQFRQLHLLHPNFYNLTIEEELIDPKWPKMDPADVVAECHSLAIESRSPLASPGPPPTGKLPALPPLPPIPPSNNGSISPAVSHTSLRSGNSWRDTQTTAVSSGIHIDGDSPVLGPHDDAVEMLRPRSKAVVEKIRASQVLDEFPLPSSGLPGLQQMRDLSEPPPSTNLTYLQREITLLRNDLNFERWHKAQYSQHIGQLMRKNVKDATVEAETLNLINANRALKLQLEQVRKEREATIRDSNLTRKQANNLESNMTERFNKMKKEQETWTADADELRRLRTEMKTYRDLLSDSEARELKTAHELEIVKRSLEQMKSLEAQLEEARRKIREYEYREWDFDQAKREHELLQSEKETLQMRIRRQDQDLQRTKQMYSERLVEMEASLAGGAEFDRPPTALSLQPGSGAQITTQRELEDTKAKLMQLKKSHSRLLERYTDLEMEYQSVKSQLATFQQGYGGDYGDPSRSSSLGIEREASITSGGLSRRPGVLESVYDLASEYGAPAEVAYSNISQSDPTDKRYMKRSSTLASGSYRGDMRGLPVSPISPPRSEATIHSAAGLTWKPAAAQTTKSQDSEVSGFNATRPLGPDERSIISGQSGGSGGVPKKEKIDVKSDVRVFGRGGAQNIKLKPKEATKADKPKGFAGKLGKGLGLS
ncbi:hypothetical protein AC578_9085 [Pseudocercospora eumusae]|uniref:Hamartin n=1 Tax=Pseudocercospora eumusae TaxID=321146 RepID=A0A139GTY8_9PEZI|nr:hypothetical protein AC578_9085 [Pseudocercospora eumusae]